MLKKLKEKFRKLFKYDYVLNTHTGEVHNLKNIKGRCHIELISEKNKKYITKKMFDDRLTGTINGRSINGCRFCNSNSDTDKKFKK